MVVREALILTLREVIVLILVVAVVLWIARQFSREGRPFPTSRAPTTPSTPRSRSTPRRDRSPRPPSQGSA
jgi:cytoskeletal protein RodZ